MDKYQRSQREISDDKKWLPNMCEELSIVKIHQQIKNKIKLK